MIVTVSKPAQKATADYLWDKIAAYSDFSWHPQVTASKNIGNVKDGSDNMIGAVRLITNIKGKEIQETITAWSNEERSQTFSIDKGLPPPISSFHLTFYVKEDPQDTTKSVVYGVADINIKWVFCFLAPLLKVALPKKISLFVDGIAALEEK